MRYTPNKRIMPLYDQRDNEDYRLLKPKEVCHYLNIGRSSFYNRIHAKTLPVVREGGRIKVRWGDLKRYIRPTSEQGADHDA